jgi:wyosine [tRNA(Phe)-imidazoG37] synthetase (radical SAM superfamily)
MELIDKTAVVAEIERSLKTLNKDRDFNYLQIKELEALLSSIDTLEVKEINSTDTFIEKVANYLNYVLYDRVEIKNPGNITPSLCAKGEFIEDFKNYMKGISYDVQNV